jgi:hypothetical protein
VPPTSFKKKSAPTEIVEMKNGGPSPTIDSGWREVAEAAFGIREAAPSLDCRSWLPSLNYSLHPRTTSEEPT